MTEDILEKLVDGFLNRNASVFTKHNVKYRPDIKNMSLQEKRKYSVNSDIDVLGLSVMNNHAYAVSCKSWQGGFNCKYYFDHLKQPDLHSTMLSGREVWKGFREITNPTWAKAFREKILTETKAESFTYIIAVTKLIQENYREKFESCNEFLNLLSNKGEIKVNIQLLTLEEIFETIWRENQKTALESSEIGRIIQLMKAAGLTIKKNS
ncbi:MAG: hypothetical protein R2750_04300 [Bacteroidales bacterium]